MHSNFQDKSAGLLDGQSLHVRPASAALSSTDSWYRATASSRHSDALLGFLHGHCHLYCTTAMDSFLACLLVGWLRKFEPGISAKRAISTLQLLQATNPTTSIFEHRLHPGTSKRVLHGVNNALHRYAISLANQLGSSGWWPGE